MFKKFKDGELFINRIKAHPKTELFLNGGVNGTFRLNRLAVNRISSGSAYLEDISGSYPFVTKEGTLAAFKSVSTAEYAAFGYGTEVTGTAPMSASISSDYFAASADRIRIDALKNTLNYHKPKLSRHFAFSSSLGNKATQAARLVGIPSLFYGSEIEKGTVSCKFYLTGTLIAELGDPYRNGELVQIGPSGSNQSGSVAGVILYKEGFMLLTGSWDLHDTYTDNFVPLTTASVAPAWRHFFTTGSNGIDLVPSSSFAFDFKGTQYIPTMTMLCQADKGDFNHSNNPTYIEHGQTTKIPFSSSVQYRERDNIAIKNVVNVSYTEEEPEFEKITYISKVGIFDEEKNLIGIAKLATPLRKKEIDSYTIKLKVDI